MRSRLLLSLLMVTACADGGDQPSPPPERTTPEATTGVWMNAPVVADPVVAAFDVGANGHGLAFSADGERIFISNGRTAGVWDVATGRSVAQLETAAHRLAISQDGNQLFAPGRRGSIALWDTSTLQGLPTQIPEGSHGAFSPDGSFVAVAGGSLVRIWSITGDSLIASVGRRFSEVAFGVAVSPDGKSIAAGYMDSAVRLWSIADGTEIATLAGHAQRVFTVAFSPDGSTLASGSSDGTVRLWDLSTMTERAVLTVGSGTQEIELSPDGRYLAAASQDGAVRLWSMSTGEEVAGMQGEARQVNAIAFSRDGDRLAAVWQNGDFKVWDVESTLASHGPLGPVPPRPPPYPTGARFACDESGVGGVITGTVVDSVTNEPVEQAVVDAYYSCRVYTDSAGRFMIADVPLRAELSVGAHKTDYGAPRTFIDLRVGDTVHVELRIPRLQPCDPASYPKLPRVETDGPEVRLRLPPAMTDVLDRVLPGFRPARLDEVAGWIVSGYRLSCYQAPSAVVGDFNGDGLDDLVAFGFVGDYEGASFVLLSDSSGYRFIERDLRLPSGPFDTYFYRVEPGLPSFDPLTPALSTHAFSEIYEEKGSTVYYARDGALVVFPYGAH